MLKLNTKLQNKLNRLEKPPKMLNQLGSDLDETQVQIKITMLEVGGHISQNSLGEWSA